MVSLVIDRPGGPVFIELSAEDSAKHEQGKFVDIRPYLVAKGIEVVADEDDAERGSSKS